LLHYIRPEMKFPDLEALKRQIAADGAAARDHLGVPAPASGQRP
jgi:FAD synthase